PGAGAIPSAAAQYADPPALAGRRRAVRGGAGRRLLAEIPAAGRPVLRADRLLGLAQPFPHLPPPGHAPARAAGRARTAQLRRAAARRPALHDRRADQPILAADDGAGGDLGDLAAAAADGAAQPAGDRRRDAAVVP